MTFVAANLSSTCRAFPTLPTCQPSVLAFMAFLVQNFGHSNDELFIDAKSSEIKDTEEYDFIIVGAGTAGCVVANRLSEINQWKVLLLEAGDEEPVFADVPSFFRSLRSSNLDWKYRSEPEPIACNDDDTHSCVIAQGKVMGGSSSINVMSYERGYPEDYDDWARLGNTGWSYEDVLPYFLKLEDNRVPDTTAGYQNVELFPYNDKNTGVLSAAWRESNLSNVDHDTLYQTTTTHGAKESSNGAFLRPIRGRRDNLVIRIRAEATRIIIDSESKKAVGVEYSLNGNRNNLKKVYARKEVIVSAGTFGSPKLLMLSGIGHAEELQKSGIKVVRDLPVGDNLHDHVMVTAFIGVLDENDSTVVDVDDMWNDAVYWLSTHEGPDSSIGSIRSTITPVNIFSEGAPDLQFNYFSLMLEDIVATENYYGLPACYPAAYYDSFAIVPVLMKPKSRGTVRLSAKDSVWSAPVIRLNLLTDQKDMETIVEGAILARSIFNTTTFQERNITMFDQPPSFCKNLDFASREFTECLASNYAAPRLRFVGTCKMGAIGDSTAVVDPRLRVHRIGGLRVIDASVMPNITSAATAAPTLMISEKGSDMIKEDWLH